MFILSLTFFYLRLYHIIWEFIGIYEVVGIVLATLLTSVIQFFVVSLLRLDMPLSFFVLQCLILMISTMVTRFAWRLLRLVQRRLQRRHSPENSTMIIGAGAAGQMILSELLKSEHLENRCRCIIDDDPRKIGKYFHGIPIVGGRGVIPEKVLEYGIQYIIVAIPTLPPQDKREILNICKDTGCKLKTLPGIYQMIRDEVSINDLRPVKVEDLLGREPVCVNPREISSAVTGKTVMVTGGGGSIGSELCRQLAVYDPAHLLVYDIYENNVYELQQELLRDCPNLSAEMLIGSVRDKNRLEQVFSQYRPNIVFHAAAHKHVPLMEDSPGEAVKNNIFGTLYTAETAARYGAERFVLISSDKAVNPTNVMGATKRVCEMIVQALDARYDTEFVAVRFGNVLGSNGSVIPLFMKQIAAGGPVSVTHPDITRFFMTISEAVSLVLQAEYYAQGGEIFVLNMGDPVKIDDLARNLIRLSGFAPDKDIRVEYIGLRPGEKLYEEVLMDEEGLRETENKMIRIAQPIPMDTDEFFRRLGRLERICAAEEDVLALLSELVPTYSAAKKLEPKRAELIHGESLQEVYSHSS